MKTISKSKVLCYVDCPRLFKFRYVLKLPEQVHPSAIIGKGIHRMAEVFYKRVEITSNAEDVKRVIKELMPDQPCAKMKLYADNFHTLVMQGIEEHGEIRKPIHREVTVEYNGIRGIIDRIDKLPDGNYAIIDYKTGSSKNIKHYMFELSLYAWLAWKCLGVKATKVGVAKLKNKNKILELFDITEEDMKKAVTLAKSVKTKIEEEEFDMKKGQTCYWCPYKDLCYKMEHRDDTNEN